MFCCCIPGRRETGWDFKLTRLSGSCCYAHAGVFQNPAVCHGCSGNHPFLGFFVVYLRDDCVLLSCKGMGLKNGGWGVSYSFLLLLLLLLLLILISRGLESSQQPTVLHISLLTPPSRIHSRSHHRRSQTIPRLPRHPLRPQDHTHLESQ